jgi:hypothetical protein
MKVALYKINFNPNCICLDVVAVAVINPAEALIAPPEKTTAFGVPRFVRFRDRKSVV